MVASAVVCRFQALDHEPMVVALTIPVQDGVHQKRSTACFFRLASTLPACLDYQVVARSDDDVVAR
jgi:hypothetical protein